MLDAQERAVQRERAMNMTALAESARGLFVGKTGMSAVTRVWHAGKKAYIKKEKDQGQENKIFYGPTAADAAACTSAAVHADKNNDNQISIRTVGGTTFDTVSRTRLHQVAYCIPSFFPPAWRLRNGADLGAHTNNVSDSRLL